jgi:hypothetical protein
MTTYTTPLGSFDSDTGDGGLGASVLTSNDQPPAGSFTFGPAYDGTVFIIKDNRLYYSKPKRPEAWPSSYYIEVGTRQEPGVTGVFHNGQPYYLTLNQIFYIQGTGNNTFLPSPMKSRCGAQSSRGAVAVGGHGIFHTGPDGIYLFNNGGDRKVTEDNLEPIFRGETKGGIPGVADLSTSWLYHYSGYLYFGYSSTSGAYPKNVFRLNLDSQKVSYFTYNDGSDINIRAIATDDANQRILIGDATGYLRVIEDTRYTDDSGTAISWEVQSKDFTLATRKHFPRWVKYDVDVTNASSVTGKLLLDDTVHQTHDLAVSRQVKRRLVGEGNGSRASVRISGSGKAIVYSAEFE